MHIKGEAKMHMYTFGTEKYFYANYKAKRKNNRWHKSNTTEAGNRRSMDLTFIRFVKQTLAKSDKENFRNDDTCKYCTYEKYCQSI